MCARSIEIHRPGSLSSWGRPVAIRALRFPGIGVPDRVTGVTVWNGAITISGLSKTINEWRVQRLFDVLGTTIAGRPIAEVAVIMFEPNNSAGIPNDPPLGGAADHEFAETARAINGLWGGGVAERWGWSSMAELAEKLDNNDPPDAAIVLGNFPTFIRGIGNPATGARPRITQWAHDNGVPTIYPGMRLCSSVWAKWRGESAGFMSYGPDLDAIYNIVADYICDVVNNTPPSEKVTLAPPNTMDGCYSRSEKTSVEGILCR